VAGLLPHTRITPGVSSVPLATRGPLGLAFVPVVVAAPGPVVAAKSAATRRNKLPAPEQQWTSADKIPKRFKSRPLFNKQDRPAVTDIRQQGIGNCYLAGLLGALANTPNGRARIKRLVTEHPGAIVTEGHEYSNGKPDKLHSVSADRYFAVDFPGAKSVTVSDVLYADDSDRDWNPIFMDSPNKVLWPSVIELAYATLHGGYDKIGMAGGVDVATCINEVLGKVDYTMLHFPQDRKFRKGADEGKLTSKDLRDACARAESRATLAATRKKPASLIGNHAYVVLRLSGNSVALYEPLGAKTHGRVDLATLAPQLEALFSIIV
jgi:hypothetical protein